MDQVRGRTRRRACRGSTPASRATAAAPRTPRVAPRWRSCAAGRPRSGARGYPPSLRGARWAQPRQAPRRRARIAMRSTARSARRSASRRRSRLRGDADEPHAGGDERGRRHRGRALLCAREREAIAVTLELWADPRTTPSAAVARPPPSRGAGARPSSWSRPLDARPAAVSFGPGSSTVHRRVRRRRDAEPCARCNGHVRLDAMLELADRLGCAELATGHYARAPTGRRRRPLLRRPPTPPRIRPTCSRRCHLSRSPR